MIYNNFFNNYIFSIVLFNIIVYIFLLLNIFLIFLNFDLKKLKTINDLKLYNNTSFVNVYIVFILLSFAGVPPFLGFVSKFLIFIGTFYKHYIFYFLVFLIFNIFIIYFYIQNFRFMVTTKISNNVLKKNYVSQFNQKILIWLNFINFINIFGILYFEEVFIYFNNIFSFYFF